MATKSLKGRRRLIDAQLRQAIETSVKSCYSLAMASGVSQASLSRFLSGDRDLRLANAARAPRPRPRA
jgi:hypothetical protein